jgi:hypothetical protein
MVGGFGFRARARQHAWLSSREGIIVGTSNGSSFEDSLRMKARPAPREGMVTVVRRLAMQIRRGPVRAICPHGGKLRKRRCIYQPENGATRQSYSQSRSAGFRRPFRSPMNNCWLTNNSMETGYDWSQALS